MTQKQMGRPPARRLWRNVWLAGTLGPVLAVTAWSGAHAVTVLPDAFASGAINLQHSSFCGAACSIQPTLGDFGNVTGLGDVAGANATATIGAAMSAFTVSSSFDVDPGWTPEAPYALRTRNWLSHPVCGNQASSDASQDALSFG